MTTPLRQVRRLSQAAAVADDKAIQRIVSFLDGLTERGELDRILDPVRPRLRMLGVVRPLRLTRLLFLPLNGAIVSAAEWVRGEPKLPRSALRILTETVQAMLGAEGSAIAAEVQALTTHSVDAIAELGARLWPAAAMALPDQPPPGWARTGLAAADYAPIAALCRPVWKAGPAMWDAVVAASDGPPVPLVQAALHALIEGGPDALAVGLGTLLLRASAPGQVIQAAAGLPGQAMKVAQQALDRTLEAPPPNFATLSPAHAAEAAQGLANWLDDLAECSLLTGGRQPRLAACRHGAEAAFRTCFQAAAEGHVLQPARQLAAAETVGDAEVAALETAARDLRALEAAGRRLGGGMAYDALLRQVTEQIAGLGTPGQGTSGLARMDLARSIEILAGPEAAAAILARPDAAIPH